MSESKEEKSDWPAILLLLVGIPIAFTFGGVWVGLCVLVVGVMVLGWSKRHDGPLPTNHEINTEFFPVSKETTATRGAALQQIKALSDQGNPEAQRQLGTMYANGEGVPQDHKEAVKWYCLSATQGDAAAQNKLGVMYRLGQGVTQDYQEALKWVRLSAEQGYAEAQYTLGAIYAHGRDVTQDYQEALKWYRLSAAQGYAKAQYRLGDMYHDGHGVPQDYVQALTWYLIAKAGGSTLANQILEDLEPLTTPAQIAEAQRMAREWQAAHHPKN